MFDRIRRFIVNLISLPLYWASFIVPRSKNIWVFGGWFGHSYTDNSKWLFESVCANEPRIRAIWLTRRKDILSDLRRRGLEAYLVSSWKGYWFSCRAGLVVASSGKMDVNRVGISRAKKLQLWHGSPMKKIGLDDKFAQLDPSSLLRKLQNLWRALFPFVVERWDVIIACSKTFQGHMASAYGVDLKQVAVTGYPRNDILLSATPPGIPFIEELKRSIGMKRVILYAPTHRQEGRQDIGLTSSFDLENTEKILTANDAVFLIKMHHCHQDNKPSIRQDGSLSRILWLKKDDVPEINPLLNYTDILITDYSGVYFDYLLLDRPVVFAPFDLDQYLSGDREMYEDYNNVATAGPKCRNWQEVMEACQEILNGNDQYRELRMSARKKYNDFVDANNCARVINVGKDMAGI